MPSEVRFAQVLEELLNERYKRNRAELAQQADISPSALSQYVTGREIPSLQVLRAPRRCPRCDHRLPRVWPGSQNAGSRDRLPVKPARKRHPPSADGRG